MTVYELYDHAKGARDAKGRFQPFYIPRGIMPQVDEADYPELFTFLHGRGISIDRGLRHPWELHFHQHVDMAHVRAMPPEVEGKPVLISQDGYVVDGNHRTAAHMKDGRLVEVIVIRADFHVAVDAVRAFPKAYTLDQIGDTIRN